MRIKGKQNAQYNYMQCNNNLNCFWKHSIVNINKLQATSVVTMLTSYEKSQWFPMWLVSPKKAAMFPIQCYGL